MLQIFAIIDDTSVMNFRKKLQHNFPKMRGGAGGQRPFGTFPKIHPFWKGNASLTAIHYWHPKEPPGIEPSKSWEPVRGWVWELPCLGGDMLMGSAL